MLGLQERSLATARQDFKRIVQAALNTLDLDYSIFDIVHVDAQTDNWKLVFFDRGLLTGQRMFQIAITGGAGRPNETVKEHVLSQLANLAAGRVPASAD